MKSHYHTLHEHSVRKAPHGDVQMMAFWGHSMYRVIKNHRISSTHVASHTPSFSYEAPTESLIHLCKGYAGTVMSQNHFLNL